MKRLIIVFIFILVFLCGCSSENNNLEAVKINKEEALNLIEEGALLIDVRTFAEFNQGHIDGAINIDVQDILEMIDSLNYNNLSISKNKNIIVYCRSGSRSNSAAEKLVELGYTNVYDLGSMDNWS